MHNSRHLGIGMTSRRTRERLVARLREKGIANPRVLDTMLELPRHIFVDEALASHAYDDTALPIGNGQTISQPFTVARMTELLLQVEPRRVLEIGTGSGYQTAVLSRLVERVYSVERINALLLRAKQRLRELRAGNVAYKLSDGTLGWPDEAPFDGILAAAAPENLPDSLLEQLADGGRLVMPVGGRGKQQLVVVTRNGDAFIQDTFDMVSFVPMLAGTDR